MKTISSIIAAAGLLSLVAFLGLAGPARAVDDVNECPAAIGDFLDPWLLVSADDGFRLADRDGDGSVCVARVVARGRGLLTLVTDNTIGNPNIIPPGPCTDPFLPVAIGNPGIFPGMREIDANSDGVLCGNASLAVRGLIIILLDNPNSAVR